MAFELDLDDLTLIATTQNIRPDATAQVLRLLVEQRAGDEPTDHGHEARPTRLNVLERRSHSAILVTARRGDGKTTFLTQLLRRIEAGRDVYSAALSGNTPDFVAKLYSLGIIDPTLVESKQNIVVMIVDRMRDAVDRHARANPDRSGEHEDVRRELRKLADGLTLLDGIGTDGLYGREWADPDYVLQQGLDRARAADEFERSLYAYVAKACRFLQIDAFVIAIDDVDTSFDRGWPVLEALRKYLATDRLRVVLSGDLGLYNMLVRREQWQQVTTDFVVAENSLPDRYRRTESLAHLIDELQDQYLVKIAPTERRVELQPLNELVAQGELRLRVGGATDEPRPFVRAMGHRIVRASLPGDQDAFASAILRLPLRSAVRILQSGAAAAHPAGAANRLADTHFVLRQVLSSVLLSRGMDAAALIDPDPRRVMHVLSIWLTKHGRWGPGARFTAGTGDEDYDLVAIVVAAGLVRMFDGRSSAMLEFALRICVVREKVERESLDPDTLKSLVTHLWPTALESPTRFVSRLAAWDVSSPGDQQRSIRLSGIRIPVASFDWDGAFRKLYCMSYSSAGARYGLLGRDRFAAIMTAGTDLERADLLQALSPPIRSFHRMLGEQDAGIYRDGGDARFTFANSLGTLRAGMRSGSSAILMLGVCRIADGRSRETGIFSVLRLIATVAELAGMGEPAGSDDQVAARIANLLDEAELFRSYPSPGRSGKASAAEGEDGSDEFDGHGSGEVPRRRVKITSRREVFSALMAEWIDQRGAAVPVMSPQTISRIWTRVTYAFDSIRSDLTEGRTLYLGVVVHRTIIAFLHAVGVEALRTTAKSISTIAYRNPVGSAQPFHRLLGLIYDDEDHDLQGIPEIAFFDHIFSCPMWGYFLARKDADMIEPGTLDYTAAIVKRYFERMKAPPGRRSPGDDDLGEESKRPRADERSFAVVYGHPDIPQSSAQFAGFYSLLNTLPIVGSGVSAASPNAPLALLVGSTPPRRKRVRVSDEDPSSQ